MKLDLETSTFTAERRIDSNLSCRGSEATRGTTVSLANLAPRWVLPHYIRIYPRFQSTNEISHWSNLRVSRESKERKECEDSEAKW